MEPIFFERSRTEKVIAVIALAVALQNAYFGVRTTWLSPPFSLTCTRATDRCELDVYDIFGKSYTNQQPLSSIVRSETRRFRSELGWVLAERDGKSWQIGNPSGRSSQRETYETLAPAFQRFLDSPAEPSYHATFAGLGGPSGILFVFIGLFLVGLALAIIDGWRASLSAQRGGAIIATRSPSLFGPRRREIPLESVARAELRRGRFFVLFAVLPTVRLCLIGKDGAVLFSTRTLESKPALAAFERHVERLNALLAK